VILLAVELNLSQNKLEGEIPNEIFGMTSLGKLAIEGRKNDSKYAMLTLWLLSLRRAPSSSE
jgi:hypothetical protein